MNEIINKITFINVQTYKNKIESKYLHNCFLRLDGITINNNKKWFFTLYVSYYKGNNMSSTEDSIIIQVNDLKYYISITIYEDKNEESKKDENKYEYISFNYLDYGLPSAVFCAMIGMICTKL